MKKNTQKENRLRAISLFSGCGGMDLGFEQAGFKTIAANEFWGPAQATFRANFPKTHLFEESIVDISTHLWELMGDEVTVVFGGPPCQGFSQSGKQWLEDGRNFLFKEFLRVVGAVMPDYVVIENVPQLLLLGNGRFKDEIISSLGWRGYNAKATILNAAHYGAPQNRKRAIILGWKKSVPEPNFPEKNRFVWTAEQAISDLEGLGTSESIHKQFCLDGPPRNGYQRSVRSRKSGPLYNHLAPEPSEIDRLRIGSIKQGSSENSLPLHLKQKSRVINPKLKKIGTLYRRLIANKPSPTITKGVAQQPWHYRYNRRLSIRELARLQGFPDSFLFLSPRYEDQAGQIGNSVPPPLAKAIAGEIIKALTTANI